jgi:hypothetical protein
VERKRQYFDQKSGYLSHEVLRPVKFNSLYIQVVKLWSSIGHQFVWRWSSLENQKRESFIPTKRQKDKFLAFGFGITQQQTGDEDERAS